MVSLADAELPSPFVTVQAADLDSPLSIYGGQSCAAAQHKGKACSDTDTLPQPHVPASDAGIVGLSSGWFSSSYSEGLSTTTAAPQPQHQPQPQPPRRSKLTKLLSTFSSKHQSFRRQHSSGRPAAPHDKGAGEAEQRNLQQLPPPRHCATLAEVDEDEGNELGADMGPGSHYHSPLVSPAWLHAYDQQSAPSTAGQQHDALPGGAAASSVGMASFTSTTWSMTPSPRCSAPASPALSTCCSRGATPPVPIPEPDAHNGRTTSTTSGWHSPLLGLSPLVLPAAGRCSLGRLSVPISPCSSLRSALVRLEVAGSRAGRLVDSLGAGLVRLTSFSMAAGVLKQAAGREVLRDWELGQQLGRGATAVTRLCTNRATALPAACKTINKAGIFGCAKAKAALMDVQREVAIMQHIGGHPNVVQLKAVYEDARAVHLVMEWCSGGSLVELLQRCPGGCLGERPAAAVMKAVLGVLAHCHARGLMNRDVKPDNVLIARPVDDLALLTTEVIKVADWGISVLAAPGQVLTELAGTSDYMAPEVLQRCYGQQADIWSAGVMLHELLTGTVPFQGATCEKLLAAITATELALDGPCWARVSAEAKQLLASMLTRNPEGRPTAQQLLDTFAAWLDQGGSAPLHDD